MTINLKINGTEHQIDPSLGDTKLLDFLHDTGQTGTKLCCGIGVCRACTVAVAKPPNPTLVPTLSCSTPLSMLNGTEITTVEGVSAGGLQPVQQAFLDHFSFQCGYCTPGFVMAAHAFLEWLKDAPVPPDDLDAAISDAIGDHICRCTGYVRYFEAVKEVAQSVIDAKGAK